MGQYIFLKKDYFIQLTFSTIKREEFGEQCGFLITLNRLIVQTNKESQSNYIQLQSLNLLIQIYLHAKMKEHIISWIQLALMSKAIVWSGVLIESTNVSVV